MLGRQQEMMPLFFFYLKFELCIQRRIKFAQLEWEKKHLWLLPVEYETRCDVERLAVYATDDYWE